MAKEVATDILRAKEELKGGGRERERKERKKGEKGSEGNLNFKTPTPWSHLVRRLGLPWPSRPQHPDYITAQ